MSGAVVHLEREFRQNLILSSRKTRTKAKESNAEVKSGVMPRWRKVTKESKCDFGNTWCFTEDPRD